MTDFGLVHLKSEGAPIHPDDVDCDLSPEAYDRQLTAYNNYYASRDKLKQLADKFAEKQPE
jgi:hypothetical protein